MDLPVLKHRGLVPLVRGKVVLRAGSCSGDRLSASAFLWSSESCSRDVLIPQAGLWP